MVAETQPGTRVELLIIRNGQAQMLSAVLGEMPPPKPPKSSQTIAPRAQADPLDGVTVTDLDAASRRQFKIPSTVQGALVVNVDANSAAYASGMRTGDVIQEINRRPVRNSQQALSISRKTEAPEILLRVWSQGSSHFLAISRNRPIRVPMPGAE
jgi:serine protease Do